MAITLPDVSEFQSPAGGNAPNWAGIKWIGPDLNEGEIPVLDLEEGAGNQSVRANQWFSVIDGAYGLESLPLGQRCSPTTATASPASRR